MTYKTYTLTEDEIAPIMVFLNDFVIKGDLNARQHAIGATTYLAFKFGINMSSSAQKEAKTFERIIQDYKEFKQEEKIKINQRKYTNDN